MHASSELRCDWKHTPAHAHQKNYCNSHVAQNTAFKFSLEVQTANSYPPSSPKILFTHLCRNWFLGNFSYKDSNAYFPDLLHEIAE